MAIDQPIQVIDRSSQSYPNLLAKRLGKVALDRLWAIGRLDLIHIPKTALFCSNRCIGDAILKAMEQAQKWREQGRCIISGFHSPIGGKIKSGYVGVGSARHLLHQCPGSCNVPVHATYQLNSPSRSRMR